MADKGKKGKGGGSGQKKGGGDKAPAGKVDKSEKAESGKAVEASAAREAHDEHDEHAHAGHDADGHGAAAAHGHKVDRREYWKIFVVLFVLTILEVGVAQLKNIPHSMVVLGLVGLALTKAACVGLFYMHLKHETKYLKMTVFLPFTAPAVYAIVLIAEGAWRLARW